MKIFLFHLLNLKSLSNSQVWFKDWKYVSEGASAKSSPKKFIQKKMFSWSERSEVE